MSAENRKSGLFSRKILLMVTVSIILFLIVVIVMSVSAAKTKNDPAEDPTTFTVKRGPLVISVTESGTIKARDQVILKNEVEGRTSIITLIPEGTRVDKGDLLVELDASSLLDQKIDQEIRVQNAEASYISAKENFAIVENQAKSDVDVAKLTLDFAKQDLRKYLDGEYPNRLKEAQARITLAEEELARARETLKWSETLNSEKYISKTELQADQLAEKKKALDLELAKNSLDLLEHFTYERDLAKLQSDVNQAEMALERTTRKSNASVVQADADLKAREAEFNRQKDKLKKLEDQIIKTKIYAPVNGLVIYATSAQRGGWRGGTEPLKEGAEIFERQELIYLPTAESAKAEVDIHEASLQKIRLGLRARITVDALPGQKFFGTVAKIAPLPDAQSMWLNPDLKVYNTDIFIDGNSANLRTGMSCRSEIIVEQYENAIYVPVQSVIRVGGEPTVYVVEGKNLVPRKVVIGLDNNVMVRIIKGLEEGEIVSKIPPLKAAAVDRTVDLEAETLKEKTEEQVSSGQQAPDQNESAMDPQKMREEFEKMTPEEREQMRQRFENMSPEEKEKMRQQFQNMSPGGRRGQGRRDRGGQQATTND